MTDENEPNIDSDAVSVDPLRDAYIKGFVDNPNHDIFIADHHTALLCIDLQYLDAAPECGVFAELPNGISLASQEYYFNRLESIVLPNVRSLQDAFRCRNLEVIHIRIQSLTKNGRDRSKGHRRLGLHAAPGSREAQFIEQVAPRPELDEIVINKTASGVFSSTNLHYVLKNMGIESLFIVGVYTNECVETTVRDACDLGYLVTVVDDCCATVTPELHEASLTTLRDRYARIMPLEQALDSLNRLLKTA